MLESVAAVTILFCPAKLWLHFTVLYKVGARRMCRMSGFYSLAVVTGHQHTRYDKALQIWSHALIVTQKLMQSCVSSFVADRSKQLAGHMSGLPSA